LQPPISTLYVKPEQKEAVQTASFCTQGSPTIAIEPIKLPRKNQLPSILTPTLKAKQSLFQANQQLKIL
jgi:hypothetical protein